MNNFDSPKRILYCMPESAGDVLISTGVIDSIKKQYPDALIYFATKNEYADILNGNKDIESVVEFDDSMIMNYRAWESFGPSKGVFDIVFAPSIVTQKIPMWIHSGFGPWLGKVYANMCDVPFGKQFIEIASADCLEKYIQTTTDTSTANNLSCENRILITVHAQSKTDTKDYDHIDDVLSSINREHVAIAQVGGPNDKKLNNVDYDLRGKTTPQELARVIKSAELHIGIDSFPMHVASTVKTKVLAAFGGTHANKVMNPEDRNLITVLQPEDRAFCNTACNLTNCAMKEQGIDKCINNVPVDDIVSSVGAILGERYIVKPPPKTIGAYMIIRDGIKYGFPFEKCISAALKIKGLKELVIVDGGSSDGTWEALQDLVNYDGIVLGDGFQIDPHMRRCIKIFQHEWDLDNPTLFGDEKTYARKLCNSNWLIQLDADEIIHEPNPGDVLRSIQRNSNSKVLDLPVINFYGNENTIRIESNFWKWRITKNDSDIIHGVHKQARIVDDLGRVSMDKRISDSCEMISSKTLEILPHKPVFPWKCLIDHENIKNSPEENREKYIEMIKHVVSNHPVIFHYSWKDLDRKEKNGEFWDSTHFGKKEQTHNTTKNISDRVKNSTDLLVDIDIEHILKDI